MTWGAVGAAGVGMVGGALFGDDGGSQTVSNSPWGPYQDILSDNATALDNMTGKRDYYRGDTVAGFTDDQNTSFDMMRGAADDIGGYNQTLGSTMGMYMDPSFMDPNRNPYQQQYVDAALRPLDQRYSEQVMPGIRGNARMTGGSDYGSTRQGVSEGIATRGYLDAVGDTTARINTDLYGKNITAQQRAMGMSPMYAQMMGMPASMYGQVGGQQQALDQLNINEDVDRYNYERDINWNDTSALMNLLHQNPGGTSTTTNSGGSDAMNMMGGALMGASIYNQFDDDIPWADSFETDDMSKWGGE